MSGSRTAVVADRMSAPPAAEIDSGDRLPEVLEAIRAAGPGIDADRELPPALAREMATLGLFRLLVPRVLGGAQMEFPVYLQLVEEVAAANGSAAWCVNQASVFATFSASMPDPLAREIWQDPAAVIANGPPERASVEAVEGGHRVSGRWNFSSGCRHATWVAALAGVEEGGSRHGRMFMLPRAEVLFDDVWQVGGLRGTGSFSFELESRFVPLSHSWRLDTARVRLNEPLYRLPLQLMFGSGFGIVALGVARAAIAEAAEQAGGKRPRGEREVLAARGIVHRQLGQAEAVREAARAFLFDAADQAWREACADGLSLATRVRLRLAATHAIRSGAQSVDIVYEVCGSDAIFESNPIQRRFQDAHTITQQIQGRMSHYEPAGQLLMGLDPNESFV